MKYLTSLVLLLLVSFAGGLALGVGQVEIKDWLVPWKNTRPRDPYVDNRDRVWFVGQKGDYVAYLDPKSGQFKRFDLEPGTGPHNLIVDAHGYVWYAGNLNAHIGKLDPESGKITKYPMPDPAARDPHTLVFDQKGDIWFTLQGSNFIGKLATQTGEIKLIAVPTPHALPYGIAVDSKNRPWICEFGANKLATVDPETMQLQEVTLPREGARPRRIVVTSDDHVWYVDYAQGFLGRYSPASGEFKEWPLPDGTNSRPYALAVDDQDRLWMVETGPQPNRFVGFNPGTQEFFSITEMENAGGSVRHMFFHKPSREVWFGTDTNYIGRARVS